MKKKKDEAREEASTEIVAPKGFDMLFGEAPEEEEEKSITEKTLERALDEMFSADGIDLKSDINNAQITAMTRGYIFADVYKSKYMSDLVRHILELSVSKNREGRKEFVKLLQAAQGHDNTGEPLRLMRKRLLE